MIEGENNYKSLSIRFGKSGYQERREGVFSQDFGWRPIPRQGLRSTTQVVIIYFETVTE